MTNSDSAAGTTEVAVAVVVAGEQVLVGRRAPGVPLAGDWEFPGGKIQPGESPADAAVREVLEETGLAIEVQKPLAIVSHQYPHGAVRLHFYLCTPTASPTPRAPFQWLDRRRLRELDFPEANAEIIERLMSGEVGED